ncbi:response regulator [Synechocystis sp. LKSZ1]|uniref:response regulator n=1 Tax=Synechocystis sp. LKSZ1 TaxID=3144951 RepID=UPI00336BF148
MINPNSSSPSSDETGDAPLILVTDDDNTIRALLVMALKQDGYRVEEAVNGIDCLAKYGRLQPNLLLLDAMMPEMDGFSCCQQVRQGAGGSEVPILMITFLDDRDSIDQAFQAGATDYITKPIHWSVLRQRVKRLLAQETPRAEIQPQQTWITLMQTLLAQGVQGGDRTQQLTNLLEQLRAFWQVERLVFSLGPTEPDLEAVAPNYPTLAKLGLNASQLVATMPSTPTPMSTASFAPALQTPQGLILPLPAQGFLQLHYRQARPWTAWEQERLMDTARLLYLISHHG